MNTKELKKLTLEDLERSGLDAKDFKKMGLIPCDETQAASILNSNFSTLGYVLPYYNLDNSLSDFVRFRFLEDLIGKNDKVVRYSQPKGTGVKIYFPPCVNWKKIAKDTTITICITEGEKKAYKASKMGIPTIGLGGVNSYISKETKGLVEDFLEIRLRGRKILVCYDNDLHSNEEVNKASKKLAKLLDIEGALVFSKLLPFNPYQKIGLDDYFLDNTLDDFNNLEEKEFSNITQMHEMNEKVSYIESLGKFYVIDNGLFVTSTQLRTEVYPHIIAEGSQPEEPVAKNWVAWGNRTTHKSLAYEPAQPQTTKDDELNLWKGWGAIPIKGDIKPFMDVVYKLFDNDEELITWFLDWVAYPIQNPATKMLTGVLIQSVGQGTGKSSLGLTIGAMYGDNYKLVDDAQLHNGNFNEWAVNKQFILGDEISGKDKRAESDKIKNLITRPTVTINRKYMPTYDVKDCINYIFTSNHPDALSIEPDDRRIFVHSIKYGNGITHPQGKALEKFRLGKGKDYLFNYFLNEHVISKGFDHRARPPMTEAKEDLIDSGRTEVESFLNDIKINPVHSLTTAGGNVLKGDLYTATDIKKLFEAKNPNSPCTLRSVGRSITKVFPNSDRLPTNTLFGKQQLKALRNIEKWNGATHTERQEHYDATRVSKVKTKKSKIT